METVTWGINVPVTFLALSLSSIREKKLTKFLIISALLNTTQRGDHPVMSVESAQLLFLNYVPFMVSSKLHTPLPEVMSNSNLNKFLSFS